jgi:MSHA biogenesis protein MshO
MIVAMVLVSIIVAATAYFAFPVRQAADVSVRAQLSDAADSALQRIARDVRLALPNSVRTACSGLCVEFIPVRTAGRYRGEASGAGCVAAGDTGGSDELAFDIAVSCFKSIGSVPNPATINVAGPLASNDFLVLNNYGAGFAGQDAYATAGTLNRATISGAVEQGGVRERINFVAPVTFGSMTFNRTLHDSPGRRFYVVTTPVTFECDTVNRTLKRWSGYAYGAAYTNGTGLLLSSNVTGCAFDYTSLGSQIGLLTLRLTLSKNVSSGQAETVSLYHSIHVSNVP